ncbi:MAG TPA: oligosaccharide flippase family protein [Saprospiraceae bacterium]|nr:oligosaccharide flippase family protein [Saprospiraceae bacterium]HMQ81550.1 oligosaccharide flippase family protein [Saprospiraceae bacterium]
MKREFLINILFLLAINGLIKPFYLFGIDRVIQNRLSEGTYGLYFALFNFTFLFQIINDFGIQYFNSRNISQHGHLLEKHFPGILMLKAGLGLLFFIVLTLVAIVLGYWPQYQWLLWMIAFNQLLSSLVLYLRSNVSGLGLYRHDSLLSVADRLLLILLCGYLLWFSPWRESFRIEWFVMAQTFSLLATALFAFSILKKQIAKLRFRFNPAFLWLILLKSAPYALAVLLMTIYNRIDGVMIERMLPDGKIEADIYASAYRLFEAGNMLGFLFSALLLPIFSRMLKQEAPLEELTWFSFRMVAAGALTLIIGLVFYRTPVMVALYDNGSAYSGQVLLYLMLGFFAVCGTYIFGTLLVANDSLKQLNRIFACSLLLNVALNTWLIPVFKAEGAAMATCITQFGVLLAELVLCRRLLNLSFDHITFIRLLAFTLLLLATGVALRLYWPFVWWSGFFIGLAAGLVLAFGLRLIHLKALFEKVRA